MPKLEICRVGRESSTVADGYEANKSQESNVFEFLLSPTTTCPMSSTSFYALLDADGTGAVLPSYSSIPHPQEQTLEFSSVHPPRGNITRKLKQATLTLRDVEEDDEGIPIYTRKNALVFGELEIVADDSIRLVAAKVYSYPLMLL